MKEQNPPEVVALSAKHDVPAASAVGLSDLEGADDDQATGRPTNSCRGHGMADWASPMRPTTMSKDFACGGLNNPGALVKQLTLEGSRSPPFGRFADLLPPFTSA
jgi:hypothetical protein